MSEAPQDPHVLAGWLSQAWYEDLCGRLWPLHVEGETYEFADDEQYAALGEADEDGYPPPDAPLIMVRKSDGRFFEVELDATVWETTVEEREARRELHRKMTERHRRQMYRKVRNLLVQLRDKESQ